MRFSNNLAANLMAIWWGEKNNPRSCETEGTQKGQLVEDFNK